MDIEEYKRNVISADILANIAGSPDARTIPGMLHQILLEQRRMADAMSQMARIEAAREADRTHAKRQRARGQCSCRRALARHRTRRLVKTTQPPPAHTTQEQHMNPAYEIHVTYTINASATFHEEYLAEITGMSVDELRERIEINESAGRTLAQTIAELAPSLVDTTVQTPDREESGEPSLKQVLRSTYDPETGSDCPLRRYAVGNRAVIAPNGLTEMQKDAVRTAVEYSSEGDFDPLMSAFPEVFSDDLVTTKWVSGKRTDELIRVANMDGARVVATRDGITHAGLVSFDDGGGNQPFLRIAGDKYYHGDKVLLNHNGWIVTVTAPKPVDRVISDPVVMACTKGDPQKRVLFRAEDGNWSPFRGSAEGVWMTKKLVDVKRLSAQTIAGLMGGAK